MTSSPRDSRFREILEAHIRAGSVDERAGLAALKEVDKLPKPKSALEKRLEELEILLHSPMASEHTTNVAAVLEGYKSGTLTWLEGQYYIFRDGRIVAGPRPMSEFDPQKVLFEEFPGPRSVWLEVVSIPQIRC